MGSSASKSFIIPKVCFGKSIIGTGPVSDERGVGLEKVEWIHSISGDPCEIFLNDVVFLGKGGYGETYLSKSNNLVIKLIKFTGESDHLDWRKELFKDKHVMSYIDRKNGKYLPIESIKISEKRIDNHSDISDISDISESDAFIADVSLEVCYQQKAHELIKSIDNKPITPSIICSGIYIRIKDRPDEYLEYLEYLEQDDMVGVIVMEYLDGVPFSQVNLEEKTTKYLKSLRDQLVLFSRNMKEKLNSIHGDTASDNIMIKEDEYHQPIVKIIDWGQADHIDLEKYYYNQRIWKEWDDPSYYDKVTRREVAIIDEIYEKNEKNEK